MKESLDEPVSCYPRVKRKTLGSRREEILLHVYAVLIDKQELNLLVVKLSEMKFR